MSLIRKHGAVLQAWACLAVVYIYGSDERRLLHFISGCQFMHKSFFSVFYSVFITCRCVLFVRKN